MVAVVSDAQSEGTVHGEVSAVVRNIFVVAAYAFGTGMNSGEYTAVTTDTVITSAVIPLPIFSMEIMVPSLSQ
jgi:hypothetical protein